MTVQEVVTIMSLLVEDDGTTLERRHGPQAVSVAQDIKSLLSVRLEEESAQASLWEQFEAQPQAVAAQLTGALEALVEADPALARRLNAFIEEYHGIIAPPETGILGTGEQEMAAQEVAPDTPTPFGERDRSGDFSTGAYLYGDILSGTESIGRGIETAGAMATSVPDLSEQMHPLPFDRLALERYLTSLYQEQARVIAIRELLDEDEERLKEFGYGTPLLIEFTHDGKAEQVVLHTVSEDGFGHERPSDRARNLLLDHATFNKLPRHVPSLDVGTFTPQGELLSLGQAEEFFNLTEYAPGRPYARDLQRIAAAGELSPGDEERAIALADYLAEIHDLKQPDAVLYRRRIRDLLGHGEGIMGMLDGYPTDFAPAPPARLEEIEKRCVAWRWRIKGLSHRLSQVHGDFHPWNVLFQEGSEFVLLDRSRGEWGEPADDVSAMSINYVLFSLRRHGTVSGPFRRLYDLFWERYVERMGDEELLAVVQPFYAWRALVVAHPVWYPSLPVPVRESLFRFVENVLATDRFDPQRVNDYLEETC